MPTTATPLGEYLRARRALVQPTDVGIVSLTPRRVAGLRRDEVAQRAGISQEYYLRLEQGRDRQPSDQVLLALGRALRLDGAAVDHMRRLVRIQTGELTPDAPAFPGSATTALAGLLDQWTGTPAYVMDGNQDVLVVNPLARAMTGGALRPGVNLPFAVFSAAARAAMEDWPEAAERTAATLRYGSDPRDRRLQEIVGTLSIRDEEFRRLWARHDARPYLNGSIEQEVHGHGPVTLRCQTLEIPGARRHVLTAFHAPAGSHAAEVLAALREELTAQRRVAV
ncbi:helix-turn-helix domain-containing protein [Curtobacterium sp. SORGH_AS_0776]|jgi:transcriptional regulator with XRE-family HTH domain|uniref:helix-turn-helix domain-containing protein n=1 Tax=Curtobacterium sp. SORGH_AS_0776 TaxID=3041798 RepID=UPI00285704C6|nr:helix-turn-helix domain-containing protein [Curtobacterium sp. SORGH_AS_0776]MDR6170465.1 transcriptional regulator with XRE-family HTH domain [Curtobacterium sp. SORGH_AS_0776]